MPGARVGADPAAGREALVPLGLDALWKLALVAPTGWQDTRPVTHVDAGMEGTTVVVEGVIASGPTFRPGRPSRVTLTLDMGGGFHLPVTAFGELREWTERLAYGGGARLQGVVQRWGDRLSLRGNAVLSPEGAGGVQARYPAFRGTASADVVTQVVVGALPTAIPQAAAALREGLAWWGDLRTLRDLVGAQGTLEDLLWAMHRPASIAAGEAALASLLRLTALDAVHAAQQSYPVRRRPPLPLRPLAPRERALPFALSPDQVRAIAEIRDDLGRPETTARVLVGDVGSGKSAPYLLAAASVVDAGGRAAVLLPNETLARQVAGQAASWWPDLEGRCVVGADRARDLADVPLLIGTTALLSRQIGALDLLVIDEQQKFSVAQRAQLAGQRAHRLEVTATCIPRTQALLTYGTLRQSRLHAGHTPKTIHTRVWGPDERPAALHALRAWLDAGEQLLVVYARKQGRGGDIKAVSAALPAWERLAPGRVVVSTADAGSEAKLAAAEAMRTGAAQILVATTTVEVGIDLPELRRVVVVDPDRFGLTQLHQLRGRVARRGGEGHCDLLLTRPVAEATRARLAVMETVSCGFAIAEADLALRGFGDLSGAGSTQSGRRDGLLIGTPIGDDVLAWAAEAYPAAATSGH